MIEGTQIRTLCGSPRFRALTVCHKSGSQWQESMQCHVVLKSRHSELQSQNLTKKSLGYKARYCIQVTRPLCATRTPKWRFDMADFIFTFRKLGPKSNNFRPEI